MRKGDDCSLTPPQSALIRLQADRALAKARAIGRFPTPISDIIEAAGLREEEHAIIDESYIAKLRHKAGNAGRLLRSALAKVIGVFDAAARILAVDRTMALARQTFVRLHETAYGILPWHRKLYAVVEENELTISPEIAELFDREANAFASEVLFQRDGFTRETECEPFGITVPLRLSRKYGASVYSAVRRYVSENSRNCVVLVLDPPVLIEGHGFRCNLRRVVTSVGYRERFVDAWPEFFTPDDHIGAMIPTGRRRMSGRRSLGLLDRNGGRHECVAEAFTQGYQVFVLIHVADALRPTIVRVSSIVSRRSEGKARVRR